MTQQTETREQQLARVRDYLNAMSAKWSPAEIVEKVREAQAAVIAAAESMPADRFATPPADGEWSTEDVLQHVLKWGTGCAHNIVRTIQQGTPAPIPPDRLEHEAERITFISARERLLAEREQLFATVLAADPTANLDVTTLDHMWFGPLNWKATLLFLRVHDLDHARQIQAM